AGRLSELRQRRTTPVAAYRGLNFFCRVGLVIRLESRNAFVLCAHPDHPHDCVFLLCGTCSEVKEVVDDRLSDLLERRAKEAGFVTKRRVIEIHGLCKSCRTDEAGTREKGR
ncbi:MAG: transcriptional repressor, partial [Geminicoccaceae bacterium]